MEIEVNGKKQNVKEGISLKDLLQDQGVNPNVVACELNLAIIKRNQLDHVRLKEGDKLEILRMIGGG